MAVFLPFWVSFLLAASSTTVSWITFHSTIYPYTVAQPSSFRHVVLMDTDNHRVDYFSPALGSFTTNVNIYAVPGHAVPNEAAYLRSIGGKHVHVSGRLTLLGKPLPLIMGDFSGIAGHWEI